MVLRGLGWTMDGIDGFNRITTEPRKMGGKPCIRGHWFTASTC